MKTQFDPSVWAEMTMLPTVEERVLYLYLQHNAAVEISGLYRIEMTTILAETCLDVESLWRCLTSLSSSQLAVMEEGLVFVPRIPRDQHFWSRSWEPIVERLRETYGSLLNRSGRPNAAFVTWMSWFRRNQVTHGAHKVATKGSKSGAEVLSIPDTHGGIDNTLPPTVGSKVLTIPQKSIDNTPHRGVLTIPTMPHHGGYCGVTSGENRTQNGQNADKKRTKRGRKQGIAHPPPPNKQLNSSSALEGGVGGDRRLGAERDNTAFADSDAHPADQDASFLPPSELATGFFSPDGTQGHPQRFTPPTEAQVAYVMRDYLRRRWTLKRHFPAVDPDVEAAKFMDHFTATKWRRSRGEPVKDWIQAAYRWLRVWPEFNQTEYEAWQAAAPPTRRAVQAREAGDIERDPHQDPTLDASAGDAIELWETKKRALGLTDDAETTSPGTATPSETDENATNPQGEGRDEASN